MIRPWAKADWKVFRNPIEDYEFHIPEVLTTRKTDKLLTRWHKVVDKALNKVCPKREARLSPANLTGMGRINDTSKTEQNVNTWHNDNQTAQRKGKPLLETNMHTANCLGKPNETHGASSLKRHLMKIILQCFSK